MQDNQFMARAIALANRGRFTTSPNPNVGCVIVKEGKIIGEGWHQRAGEPHAEIHALQMAKENAVGATAYVTLEPCSHTGRTPPCCEALYRAGISRVVAAMTDPSPLVSGRGLTFLAERAVSVSHGLLREDAEQLNKGFFKRMRTGLPYVVMKLAASLDGRTAMANGESQWITSAAAREDVQLWRAKSAAILTSSSTVIADDPLMTVRWSQLSQDAQQLIGQESALRQPVRILLDSQQRVSAKAKLFHQPGETWWLSSQHSSSNSTSVVPMRVPAMNGQIDLVAAMVLLGQRQINDVWVECGAKLAGGLIQANLVDELIVYQAPMLLGSQARGLVDLPGMSALADASLWQFVDVTPVGADLRLILRPR